MADRIHRPRVCAALKMFIIPFAGTGETGGATPLVQHILSTEVVGMDVGILSLQDQRCHPQNVRLVVEKRNWLILHS